MLKACVTKDDASGCHSSDGVGFCYVLSLSLSPVSPCLGYSTQQVATAASPAHTSQPSAATATAAVIDEA